MSQIMLSPHEEQAHIEAIGLEILQSQGHEAAAQYVALVGETYQRARDAVDTSGLVLLAPSDVEFAALAEDIGFDVESLTVEGETPDEDVTEVTEPEPADEPEPVATEDVEDEAEPDGDALDEPQQPPTTKRRPPRRPTDRRPPSSKKG